MALILRTVVGRELTYEELDGNFNYLLSLINSIFNQDGTIKLELLPDGVFAANGYIKALANGDLDVDIDKVKTYVLSGATTLVTPGAMTGGTVDNTARTFTTALPSYPTGLTVSDKEDTLDGGLTYTQATSLSLYVGAGAYAVGKVGSRIKAVSGVRNVGPTLFNTTAFTASTAATTLLSGYTFINAQTGNATGREIDLVSPNKYSSDTASDHPFVPGMGYAVGSSLAMKVGSHGSLEGFSEGGDASDTFKQPRVYHGFREDGTYYYGNNQQGDTVAATQPPSDGWVVITARTGAIYDITYLNSDGVTNPLPGVAGTTTLSYNLLSTNPFVKGTMANNAVLNYPQGKGLTTYTAS